METIVVDTLDDENDGVTRNNVSLRDAINRANAIPGEDTINFDADLAGGTITLTTEEPLRIVDNLRIVGLGPDQIAINGNNQVNVFEIDDGFNDEVIQVLLAQISVVNGETGIYNDEELTVSESTISGNTDSGIENDNIANILNSTVSNNTHGVTGGGIRNNYILNITNSTISGNSANTGGGIDNGNDDILNITNSTISGNSAETGGGIYGFSATMSILNSTITNNQADESQGSAIAINIVEEVEIGNSIVAGNISTDMDIIGGDNVFTSLGGNLIGLGNAARVFTEERDRVAIEDPGLGELTDNGGPTFTHLPLEDSLAIDAGLNELVSLESDQRGTPRIVADRVDIGAVEIGGLHLRGTNGDDLLVGSDLDDTIEGLRGRDTLTGGRGNDVLVGGRGRDIITGGRGRDEFQFERIRDRRDLITDFNPDADLITVSIRGFGNSLSRGILAEDQFIIVSDFEELEDSFSLGFVYATDARRLAYIDTEEDISLTQIAILRNQPELENSNIMVF
ncbi:choice-of-anchor Q domain-containing protein [Gloeocapsa sp. PCC 73106]|uniref:choice-of-anchor Q domain-containing protein n=1 Tax=Gloeocapsa sp. PCC 73106 TaxID=102232 RepID=UPI0002ABB074|nr:choice-of-anchor Q domain-containing protein [Gloeocapsa sp. PCC 73106]ELR98562.1 putative calcium-binding protein [Gloeocapsa sp. PCC 73106]